MGFARAVRPVFAKRTASAPRVVKSDRRRLEKGRHFTCIVVQMAPRVLTGPLFGASAPPSGSNTKRPEPPAFQINEVQATFCDVEAANGVGAGLGLSNE